MIDAVLNKTTFVNGNNVGVLKQPLQDAVSRFDGALNLFVMEHLMRRGLWYDFQLTISSILGFHLDFNTIKRRSCILSYTLIQYRYTASVMATEAEFLQGMQPPDIEEVKVVSSTNNENPSKFSTPSTCKLRHSAEKLDEDTIRSAINSLFLQPHHQPHQVCKPSFPF